MIRMLLYRIPCRPIRAGTVACLVPLLVVGLGLAAPSASAAWMHLRLLRAEPAADARLATSPHRVALWFSERPELAVTRVRLVDARAIPLPLAAPTRADSLGAPVVTAIPRPLAPGRYTVVWRTMARDGHGNGGQYTFTVDGAGGR